MFTLSALLFLNHHPSSPLLLNRDMSATRLSLGPTLESVYHEACLDIIKGVFPVHLPHEAIAVPTKLDLLFLVSAGFAHTPLRALTDFFFCLFCYFNFYIMLFYWGYIAAFIKVLTIYHS
jgi:hypothetical protein